MRSDTLTYYYYYHSNTDELYNTLLKQQLKYFHLHDKNILKLHVGDKINTSLKTKFQKLDSVTTIEVTRIVPNSEFQLKTYQAGNHDIVQTFKFQKDSNGKNKLVYSEQTNINTVRGQTYFFFTMLLYKFFYNRGMKRKLSYLDHLALKGG